MVEKERLRNAMTERRISNIDSHGSPDELPEDPDDF
jgi:hypothetical protein